MRLKNIATVLFICSLMVSLPSVAQDDVYPAKPYAGLLFISNATIHVGNGQVIENGTIEVREGKIVQSGKRYSHSGR